MEDDDELLLTLSDEFQESFDLDFSNAYSDSYEMNSDYSYLKYMNPCYLIEEETIDVGN